MNKVKADPNETVRGVIHEIRSRMGAIKLAVTTLQDIDPGPEDAALLLKTADEEATRVSIEMSGVTALVACMTDRSRERAADIGTALRRAAIAAKRRGVETKVSGPRSLMVKSRPTGLDQALPIVLSLAGDLDARVTASLYKRGDVALVRVQPVNSGAPAKTKLLEALLQQVGATPRDSSDAVEFTFALIVA